MNACERLARDERGLSTVEYILILVLLAIVGIVSWRVFGASVGQQVDEARGGITTLDGQGAPTSGSGSMAAGGAPGGAGSGRPADSRAADDSVHQSAAGSMGADEASATGTEDRDPVATQRGSLQAGEGRVTPLRADGVPSVGDPSAGRGGGGMWKVLATIFLVILGFLAGIPLLARLRK